MLKNYADVVKQPVAHMVAFTARKIFVERLTKAEAARSFDAEGLKSLKDSDTGMLTPRKMARTLQDFGVLGSR